MFLNIQLSVTIPRNYTTKHVINVSKIVSMRVDMHEMLNVAFLHRHS
jgi:hypothetical protein